MIKNILKKLLPDFLVIGIQHAKNEFYLKKEKTHNTTIRKKYIENLLKRSEPIYLELGAGEKKGAGNWITMDLAHGCDLPTDLLQTLPFPDNSVEKIYSSHFLEHFQTLDILKILKESHRILKPGGWISACVPDGSIYINAYCSKKEMDPKIWLRYTPAANIFSKIDYVNYMAYLGTEHKHLFDQDNLSALFEAAGFKNVRPRSFNPEYDMKVRDYQSIYVEATK
jgi:predicted SAM-dependent methyltransferase